MTTTTIEFETFVTQVNNRYVWFVVGDYNNHVLAQGTAKTEKTAQRQANEAALMLKADLWGVGHG